MSDPIEEALQGDTGNPVPCDLPACGTCGSVDCSCDAIQGECASKPSKSPLAFRTPVGQCQGPDENQPAKFFDTVETGLIWPAVGFDVTVSVPDPSKYALGQCVEVLGGFGWLKVSAVRTSSKAISLRNEGFRANSAPGTQTPTPVNISPGTCPKPDATYDDIKAETESAIGKEVTSQVNEKIDTAPNFPSAKVDLLESGRLAMWNRGESCINEDSSTAIGEQAVRVSPEGYLATVRNLGCDSESVRFDKLNPAPAGHGQLLGVTPINYCDAVTPPAPRIIEPENVTEESPPSETFGFLGYSTDEVACTGGNVFKKIWKRLSKFLLHENFFFTPVTDDDSLHILIANKSANRYKIAPLTLGENEVLAGDGGGGVKIKNVLDIVPPSVVAAPGEPPTIISAAGDTPGMSFTPNNFLPAPEFATHAIVSLRLLNANNSLSEMTIAGVLRLSSGHPDDINPSTSDTIAWIPIATPSSAFEVIVASGNQPATLWSIKLIGYQSNRP